MAGLNAGGLGRLAAARRAWLGVSAAAGGDCTAAGRVPVEGSFVGVVAVDMADGDVAGGMATELSDEFLVGGVGVGVGSSTIIIEPIM